MNAYSLQWGNPHPQNSTTRVVKDYRSIKASLTMVFAFRSIGFTALLKVELRSLKMSFSLCGLL